MADKFETEIIEPEERKAVDFNPLDEQVNEKAYTSPQKWLCCQVLHQIDT